MKKKSWLIHMLAMVLSLCIVLPVAAVDVPDNTDALSDVLDILENQLDTADDIQPTQDELPVEQLDLTVQETVLPMRAPEAAAPAAANLTAVEMPCLADTFVHKGKTDTHGGEKTTKITTGNSREGYYRFSLGEPGTVVERATFRFWHQGTSRPVKTFKVGSAGAAEWDENTLIWDTKPAYTYVADFDTVPGGNGWIEVDVTDAVQQTIAEGGAYITFALYDDITDETGLTYDFGAKEGNSKPTLNMQVEYTPVPTVGVVECDNYILIPDSGENRIPLSISAQDQFGNPMEDVAVEWSVENEPQGVWTDGDELVVGPDAQHGFVTVTAAFGETSASKDILVSVNDLHSNSFTVLKDATVQSGSTNLNKNYGGDKLMIRADGQKKFYITFNFEGMQGAIQSARLKLYKDSATAGTIKLAIANTSDWIEGDKKGVTAENGELCFENAPAYGPELAAYQLGAAKGYIELDITDAIQQIANTEQEGDKVYTLVLYGDVDGLKTDFTFMSRESTTPPELNIDYYYRPVVNKVTVSGPGRIIVPDAAEPDATVAYAASLKDDFGQPIDERVMWSVSGAENVSVDSAGNVIVSAPKDTDGSDPNAPAQPEAADGFDLIASAGGVDSVLHVELIDNDAALALAKQLFNLDELGMVTDDLDLPSTFTIPDVGGGTVSIDWTSGNEDILKPDGTVIRPPLDYPTPTVDVEVFATFRKGESSTDGAYTVTVAKQGRRITIKPDVAGFYYRTQFTPWDYQMKSGMRWALLRFDLSEYVGQLDPDYIYSARLRMYGDAKEYIETHFVPDDTWADGLLDRVVDGVVPDLAVPEVRDALGGGYYVIEDDTKSVGVDVLDVLKRDLAGDADSLFSLRTGSARTDLAANLTFKDPVLELEAIYDAQPASLTVEQDVYYDEKIRVPWEGTEERTYVVTTLDQFGSPMEDTHTFELLADYPGVSISQDGVITVDGSAQPGRISFRATSVGDPSLTTTYDIDVIEKIEVVRPRLYLSEDEIYDFRQRIISSPQLLEHIQAENTTAESVSGNIGNLFELNGWRASIDTPVRTFVAPEQAAYAEFGITARGVGKVMWDAFEVQNLGKENMPVANADFETGIGANPAGWTPTVVNGSPVLKWEDNGTDSTLAFQGKRSISYEGFSEDDEATWFADRLPIKPGDEFYFGLQYSQKHYLSNGFTFTIRYFDADGQPLGTEETEIINWKTQVRRNGYFAPLVSNSILYLLENDEKYLDRVKNILEYITWEMIFQIERGDMSTGAVHVGRTLPALAFGYELLDYAGTLTPEEDKLLRSNMYWLMDKMMDVSFYNYNAPSNALHNYNADRSSGLGCLALGLPEYSKSEEVLAHAIEQWEMMIGQAIGEDGAWHETIRYHNAVFKVFFPFTVMLKNAKGIDLFENPKVKNYGSFIARVQGPRDKVNLLNPNSAILPNAGDSAWFEGNEAFGRTAYMVKDSDPKLSREIMYAWQRMGSPYPESNPTVYTHMDPYLPAQRPNYVSTAFGDIGYVVFRQNYDMANEDYMHIIAKGTGFGSHQHLDRGSFQMWKNGVPLVMEAGVGNYDKSGAILETADYHNVTQFVSGGARDGDSLKDDTVRFVPEEDFYASNDLDTMRTNLSRGTGEGSYNRLVRNIAFVKNNFGVYIMWDDLGYDQPADTARYTYHALTTGSSVNGNTITSPGYGGMTLDATFLQDDAIAPQMEWQLMAEGYPQINEQNQFQSISVEHPADEDFLIAMYPRESGEPQLETAAVQTGNGKVAAYQITKQGAGYFLTMKNSATSAQTVRIPATENLTDMRTGDVYRAQGGVAEVTIGAKEMVFLRPDSVAAPVPTEVTLEGVSSAGIPTAGEAQYVFTSLTKDQYGNTMERANEDAVWSVSGDTQGVTVDNDGVLYVTSEANVGGTVTVTVSADGVQGSHTVRLAADTGVGSVDIEGPQVVPSSSTGVSVVQYNAVFTDKYGVPMDNLTAAWYLNERVEGVSLDPRTGKLSVASTVPKGTKIEIVVECAQKPNVTKTMLVTVGDRGLSKIEISGPSLVGIPAEAQYTARGLDQFGTHMLEETATFSLEEPVDGVSITPDGVLTVTDSAAEDSEVVVKAVSQSDGKIAATFRVRLRGSVPSSVTVSGAGEVDAPDSGYATSAYTAVVKDQKGNLVCAPVVWTVSDARSGVEINKNTGVLQVSSAAPSHTVTVTAAVVENPTVKASKSVDIVGRPSEGNGGGGGGSSGGGGGGGGGVIPVPPLPVPSGEPGTQPSGSFTDIDHVAWAKDAIESLSKQGIVKGMGDGRFAPDDAVTREQFAAMLVNAFGLMQDGVQSPFTDVQPGTWYAPYVASAYQKGIITGVSDTEFGVGANITREQMAAMVYRTAQSMGIALPDADPSLTFKDGEDIALYAQEAVAHMQAAGILTGMDDGRFAPRDPSTRAQAAVVIYRLLSK